MPVVLDANDLERDDVAVLKDFLGVTDAPLHDLRHVHQTLDGARQASEGAERDELGDDAGDDVADGVLGDHLLPLLRRGTADGERDLLVFLVDAEDVDVDLVADLEEFLRLGVAVP